MPIFAYQKEIFLPRNLWNYLKVHNFFFTFLQHMVNEIWSIWATTSGDIMKLFCLISGTYGCTKLYLTTCLQMPKLTTFTLCSVVPYTALYSKTGMKSKVWDSQLVGAVQMCGIHTDNFIANLQKSLSVDEFWKLISIWRSYGSIVYSF